MSPIPVSEINRFTREEGEKVRHLIGMRCYCIRPDGQPDPNCKDHENGGWLYRNEQPIVGLVTGVNFHKDLMATGAFIPGDCVFSPQGNYTVSEMDKIIFTWPEVYGPGEPLIRGKETADNLYYEAVKALYCVDEDKVVYRQDVDFQFSGKTIIWNWTGKSGQAKAPAAGKRYTIKYKAYIEWIAFVPPVVRVSHGKDMGNKVMLRKRHLFEK